jgi:putative sigma-54 modulation protein
MQINVSGRHVELTQPIEEYCNTRSSHLEKFRGHVQSITFVLDKVHDDFVVEIMADVEHHSTFVAKASDHDLYAGIDAAIDKVVRQLHDWKEKISDHKSH